MVLLLRRMPVVIVFLICFSSVSSASTTAQNTISLKSNTKQSSKVTLQDLLGGNIKAPVVKRVEPNIKSRGIVKQSSSPGGGLDTGIVNVGKTIAVDQRSGGAGNGVLGVGWSMEMGSVVRSTKNGVPHYDNTDTFQATLGGKSYELVSLGSNNEYRSKFDDDRMREIRQSGSKGREIQINEPSLSQSLN